jgi:hypothetical protein
VLRPLYESPAGLAQKSTIAVWAITYTSCIRKFLLDSLHMVCIFIWLRLSLHSNKDQLFDNFVKLMKALRYLRRIAAEESGEIMIRNGQHPAVLRTLSQRLAK